MPTIREFVSWFESIVPKEWQESYDNCGLLTGNPSSEVSSILLTLDCTEKVVEEAIQKKATLILAHHPLIFKPLKRLTGSNEVERTLMLAIQHNIAIYAAHTNWDSYHLGVSKKMADKLGLQNTRVISPRQNTLLKIEVFVPRNAVEQVTNAMHKAGAGNISNYSHCRFQAEGNGFFMPNEKANPTIGSANKLENVAEVKVEMILSNHLEEKVLNAMNKSHPYEEVAYFITPISNENQEVGLGISGELSAEMDTHDFLQVVKKTFGCGVIRHSAITKRTIKKVSLCGGAGSFLIPQVKAIQSDIFLTGDMKYHDFFDSGTLILADIGHYESEQFTPEIWHSLLSKKFPTFALHFSTTQTNPIYYL